MYEMLKRRVCELGKIKIGGLSANERKAKNGNTYRLPEKHDHFTITTMLRDARGDLMPDKALMDTLLEEYGSSLDKDDRALRQIPITVLSDDIEEILQVAYVWYCGKKLGARSEDGKKVLWYVNARTKEPLETPKEDEWKESYANSFKLHSVFSCAIRSKGARWGGIYKFRTTSTITANQLYNSLQDIRTLTHGILKGLPLVLVVRPVQVAPNGKSSTVYVVHVELQGPDLTEIQHRALEFAQYQATHAKQIEAIKAEYRKALVAPGHESEDEITDIRNEFLPDDDAKGAPPAEIDPLLEQIGAATGIEESTRPVELLKPAAPTDEMPDNHPDAIDAESGDLFIEDEAIP